MPTLSPASTFVRRRARVASLLRVGAALMVLACGTLAVAATGAGQDAVTPLTADEAWSRVFLRDGQVLATYGAPTRVDDLLAMQVPVGVPDSTPPLTRTVTIPASLVDWSKTDAYREAMQRAQFARSGGERAYAAFTEDVAATLRDVAQVPDPLERIRRLDAARTRLAQWPAAHHGYRAQEVAQSLSVIDDLLNGMRAAAGQQTFSLALTASGGDASPPADAALLPPPGLREVIEQSIGLAPRIHDPAERLALLEATATLLSANRDGFDRRWARATRGEIDRQITREYRVTRAYARLRTWMLEKTARLLAMADVRGLMRLREDVQARDARLDRGRPDEMRAMLGTLDARLEQARRQRLLVERWKERRPALERYAAVVGRHVAAREALPRALEDVKALSGPDPALLTRAEAGLAGARADAGLLVVPEEARGVQQVWTSAQHLAARAFQTRRAAVRSGDLQQAWAASAAAAGALMLLQQLRTDLATLVRAPAPAGQGS